MKVSELGEFGLLKRLQALVPGGQGVLVGIGDDAAVVQGSALELATTDSQVEGTHFTLETASPQDLGWKALAVNISDIAAMGGVPRYALVSLSLPPTCEVEWVLGVYRGLLESAKAYQVAIAGGDLHTAPIRAINVSLLGCLQGEAYLSRSASQVGDLIGVTGYLGGAAGGLRMLKQELKFNKEVEAYLRRAHWRPSPRVKEGQELLRLGVRAAIDISDGLMADLGHLCQMSGVGARVVAERVPIHPLLRQAFGAEALALALGGGEDYELLFTCPPSLMERVRESLDITVLGEMTGGETVEVADSKGRSLPLGKAGWEHFAPGNSKPQP
jgi:thiamine-monophosphate kinase